MSGCISQTGGLTGTGVWVSVTPRAGEGLVRTASFPLRGVRGAASGCVSHIGGVTEEVPGGVGHTGDAAGACHSHKGL